VNAMNEQDILKQYIEQDLLAGRNIQIGYEDDLLLSGVVSSLGVMRLVAFAQERFGIQVPPEDIIIEHFETIQAIVRYLETRRS
jgi:acyl carrier protein